MPTKRRTTKKALRKSTSGNSTSKKSKLATGMLKPEEEAERRINTWKSGKSREAGNEAFKSSTPILRLSDLGLKRFPESLRTLSKLEVLDLLGNKITQVPVWIRELVELKAIRLSENPIRTLPPEIGLLPKLDILTAENTELTDLPRTLSRLRLTRLDLDKNPKLRIPKSILKTSPKEILRYYFESREKKGRPLMELKLLLVGRGKAGKTTLVKQLAGEKPDENESETHSIAIRELTLDCPRGSVRTRAWDLAVRRYFTLPISSF